jgi:hypothetical protein
MMLTNPLRHSGQTGSVCHRFSENVLDATNDFALFVDDVRN